MNKRTIIVYSLSIVLILCCGVYLYQKITGHEGHQRKMPPTVIQSTLVKQVLWQHTIPATGTLVAHQGILLKTEVAGRVSKILFHSGREVKAGDALVQLNPAVLKAELAYNKAQYAQSSAEYRRVARLLKEKAISVSVVDKAKAAMDSNDAQIQQSKAQLAQLHITAPFAGKIGLRQISVGDYLAPGAPIANLEAMDPMYVDFSLPQVTLKDLAVGARVDIHSRTYPKQGFIGKVLAYDSQVNPGTRTINVRANVPNKGSTLIPGSFVELKLYVGRQRPTLIVPLTAIVYAPTGNYVYRIVKGHAIKTSIELGQQRAGNVEVISGLAKGETVITAGQLKLYNDAPVMTEAQAQQMFNHKK